MVRSIAARRSGSFHSGICHRIRAEQMDGRAKTLLEPAKQLKSVRSIGDLSNALIPDPLGPLTSPILGIEKFLFQISANRLEVDENTNRAHVRMDTLAGCEDSEVMQ